MGKYGYMADFPKAIFPGDDKDGCVEGERGGGVRPNILQFPLKKIERI